jgi:uncharacterized ubiquitin-like protein YukD
MHIDNYNSTLPTTRNLDYFDCRIVTIALYDEKMISLTIKKKKFIKANNKHNVLC